jgi:hypothetical protein
MKRVFLGLLAGMVAVATPWVSEPAAATLTFYKDVLPILQNRCQSCHRPGQIAPISFMTYRETRPWAEAMKTMVVSRRMPPWSSSSARIPGNYHFLTDREIETIARWVEQGALEGDPKDAPAPLYGNRPVITAWRR